MNRSNKNMPGPGDIGHHEFDDDPHEECKRTVTELEERIAELERELAEAKINLADSDASGTLLADANDKLGKMLEAERVAKRELLGGLHRVCSDKSFDFDPFEFAWEVYNKHKEAAK